MKDEEKITVFDIPSLFQLSLAQESQQDTIEQIIVELKATRMMIFMF